MSCNVQIRNVSPEFHRRLKARAALEGLSMSDYILREVGKALDRPMRSEVLERIRARPTRRLARKPADVIQDERNQGERTQGERIKDERTQGERIQGERIQGERIQGERRSE